MAQHDYVIANQGFPAFRSDLNDALAAIVSNNSGATEPATMFAHQMWVDTAADPSVLKIRNADNDAWITIGTINQTGDIFTLTSAVSATTLNTSGAVVFNDAGADVDFRVEGDTEANLLFVDASADAVGIGTSSPSFSVDVVRSGGDAQLRLMSQATGTNGIIFRNNAAPTSAKGAILYPNGSAVGGDTMQFVVDASERMRINSSGDVGIGTTATPSASAAISRVITVTGSNAGILQLTRTDATAGGCAIATASGPGMLLYTHTGTVGSETYTERARITSGGYFKATSDATYVGSTSAYHEFIQSANNVGLYVQSKDASLGSPIVFPFSNRSQNSGYSYLTAASSSGGDNEFVLRGDGNGYADGTWNNNGADYAEFFESANGEALTLGATVVLDGNKVREATEQDSASAIIGVVRPKEPSKASMVIGNTAWNKWANKYLTDDFDRYIMEDHDVVEWEETITDAEGNTSTKQHSYESHAVPEGITVPEDATVKTHDDKGNKFQHYKLNPEWNPDSEYVNRENRAEWNIIGLLGQVKILKGQPVGDRWIKMRDISETVEEWFIR